MVTSFQSVQDNVSKVLGTNKYINWNLLSSRVDGDRCYSEFESNIDNSSRKYHLSYVITPSGDNLSYSVI